MDDIKTTWTDVDFSLVKSCDIQLWAVSLEMLMISIIRVCCETEPEITA